MRQLAHATDAGVEALRAAAVAVTAVALEQVPASFGERQNALTRIHRDESDESFIPEMAQTVLAYIRHVALGHDAKGTNGRQCPDIVTIELVPVSSVEHELAVLAPRQFEV